MDYALTIYDFGVELLKTIIKPSSYFIITIHYQTETPSQPVD